jgi:ribose-phosphate pyrophosphokinase
VDTHNPILTESLIHNFANIEVTNLHRWLVDNTRPNYVVFPDAGAQSRYSANLGTGVVVCNKVRDQLTGAITGHDMVCPNISAGDRFLIIDDICDGGATFISIAKKLRSLHLDIYIDLFVTHGIFSKGKDILMTNGINTVYTTNSLTKNGDGFEV